jgi:YhcH/YjgK/YiaL family protein
MIIAPLTDADAYTHRHPRFDRAFDFLRRDDLTALPPGRHAIDDERVFATVWTGPGRRRDEVRLEAHRKYIDIQYIISGPEEMGWKPLEDCGDIAMPYRPEDDIVFFNDTPAAWTTVPAGSFVIFFPEDAHAPVVGDGDIRKVIIKIAVQV